MQSGQFARQIQADPVARRRRRTRAMMESFEDVFGRRNRSTVVSNRQHDIAAVATCNNPDSPTRTIVLSRVLQKILHDERRVAFLASHKKTPRMTLFT